MKKYDKYIQFDSDFKPIADISIKEELPPGVYDLKQTPQGEIYFSQIKTNYDALVHLPNTKYDEIIKEVEVFLSEETKARFAEKGFLYKSSVLAYGPHGSGKSCIINRVTEKVLEKNGIVLFSPDPKLLPEAFKALEAIQPGVLLMVIFEELDELLELYESDLLSILDGEIQKNNVMYMATTNNIEKIPARIRRPGRFSAVIKVDYPPAEARKFYLKSKLGIFGDELDIWVEKTEGFSIDELKETVRSVYCLQKDLDTTIVRILENKQIGTTPPTQSYVSVYDDSDLFDRELSDYAPKREYASSGVMSSIVPQSKSKKR